MLQISLATIPPKIIKIGSWRTRPLRSAKSSLRIQVHTKHLYSACVVDWSSMYTTECGVALSHRLDFSNIIAIISLFLE